MSTDGPSRRFVAAVAGDPGRAAAVVPVERPAVRVADVVADASELHRQAVHEDRVARDVLEEDRVGPRDLVEVAAVRHRGPRRRRSTRGRGPGSRCRARAAPRTRRPAAGARRSRSRRAPRRRRTTRPSRGSGCGHRRSPGRPSRARRRSPGRPAAARDEPPRRPRPRRSGRRRSRSAFGRGRAGSIVRTVAARMRIGIAADARLRVGVSHAQPRLRRSRRRLREAKGAQSPGSSRHPFAVAPEEA